MYQLPSVSEQFAAALSALIPFLLAVGLVSAGIWKFIQYLYRWRYDGQIEQLETALRVAKEWNGIQKERQDASDKTVNKLADDLEAVRTKLAAQGAGEAEAVLDLTPLDEGVKTLQLEVKSASEANTAVDEALRRGATVTGSGGLSFSRPSAAIQASPADWGAFRNRMNPLARKRG
jgi:uncharacterized protein (DUF3084 family)